MKKQVDELSLDRAKTLLGDKTIKEDKLKRMLERIKAFCRVSYLLYIKGTNPDKTDAIINKLESEPPDQFTKAA